MKKKTFKFKIPNWPYYFDGRKLYSIKKIVKDENYLGGYKVILNETKTSISLGALLVNPMK